MRQPRGFTLIEMMVTIAIIGLMMSLVFGAGQTLLPQERLKASTQELASSLHEMRTHAVFAGREVVFVYDLEHDAYRAYHPFELDDEGRIVGPGESPVLDWRDLEKGMALESVRLPDGDPRVEGRIELHISPLGRVTPHDIVVYNPDYPDLEVFTVRVSGLSMECAVVPGRVEPEVIEDAHFR